MEILDLVFGCHITQVRCYQVMVLFRAQFQLESQDSFHLLLPISLLKHFLILIQLVKLLCQNLFGYCLLHFQQLYLGGELSLQKFLSRLPDLWLQVPPHCLRLLSFCIDCRWHFMVNLLYSLNMLVGDPWADLFGVCFKLHIGRCLSKLSLKLLKNWVGVEIRRLNLKGHKLVWLVLIHFILRIN